MRGDTHLPKSGERIARLGEMGNYESALALAGPCFENGQHSMILARVDSQWGEGSNYVRMKPNQPRRNDYKRAGKSRVVLKAGNVSGEVTMLRLEMIRGSP